MWREWYYQSCIYLALDTLLSAIFVDNVPIFMYFYMIVCEKKNVRRTKESVLEIKNNRGDVLKWSFMLFIFCIKNLHFFFFLFIYFNSYEDACCRKFFQVEQDWKVCFSLYLFLYAKTYLGHFYEFFTRDLIVCL